MSSPESIHPDTEDAAAHRLSVLRSYRILGTPPEAHFDELTRLAAIACRTSIAGISLVDEHRQWFKAVHGLTVRETEGQQAMLEIFGCDEFQGYLHGRSMPVVEARQLALSHCRGER